MSLPFLFPVPRSIAELDGGPAGPDAPIEVVRDPGIRPQGYRLTYAAAGIRLAYSDAAGLRYGQDALDQLRGAPLAEQAACEIDDWPDFAHRGFMLDVARDRVPTRASLARLVEVLARSRINQLEIYLEHTFAYAGHAAAWQDASPLTADDMRWLDDLCASKGIALVANQNTFGHWERWLEHDAYAARGEVSGPIEMGGQLRPPSTLAPTAENAAFVTGLVDELQALLRSDRVNVGADETWELGRGASRERAERDGIGRVYLDYVTRVLTPWIERGYGVEFWADILANHPEVAGDVPAGAKPVVWQYDSPELMAEAVSRMTDEERRDFADHGVDLDAIAGAFRSRSQALVDAGTPFWVAPGTSAWLSLIGRIDNAIANIDDAVAVGLENGSDGILTTTWGDHGHYDPPAIAYPGIVYAGGAGWASEANRGVDLARVLGERIFDDETGIAGRVLVEIGRVTARLGVPIANASPLFRVLLFAEEYAERDYPAADRLAEARAVLAGALEDLEFMRPTREDPSRLAAEVGQAVRLAILAVDLLADGILLRDPSPADRPAARAFASRLDALLAAQRSAWLLSSREGGLADSIARLAPLRRALARRAA
ncbi:family 20 glycosylhydrolase [Microbacterium indicum]|uniref:family 20 glycosylhydrolase n=1 Tax=Microbacterium indicum TaxID=358100 RepID=UPI000409AD34|nr:family 20 glycosylhydrolase [Microbacterium indicum]